MLEATVKHLLAVSHIALLLVFDETMKIVAASPALDEIAGYNEGDLTGKQVSLINNAKPYSCGDAIADVSLEDVDGQKLVAHVTSSYSYRFNAQTLCAVVLQIKEHSENG